MECSTKTSQAAGIVFSQALRSTEIPTDSKMAFFLLLELDDEDSDVEMAPMQMNPYTTFDNFVAGRDTEATNKGPLTSDQLNQTTNTAESAFVPIYESELQLTQLKDHFCFDILVF